MTDHAFSLEEGKRFLFVQQAISLQRLPYSINMQALQAELETEDPSALSPDLPSETTGISSELGLLPFLPSLHPLSDGFPLPFVVIAKVRTQYTEPRLS